MKERWKSILLPVYTSMIAKTGVYKQKIRSNQNRKERYVWLRLSIMKVHMYSQHIARIIKSVLFVCNVTLMPVVNWKINKRKLSSQFPKSKERKPVGTNRSSRTKHDKPGTNPMNFRNRMKSWKQRSIHSGWKQRQLNYSMGTDDTLSSIK